MLIPAFRPWNRGEASTGPADRPETPRSALESFVCWLFHMVFELSAGMRMAKRRYKMSATYPKKSGITHDSVSQFSEAAGCCILAASHGQAFDNGPVLEIPGFREALRQSGQKFLIWTPLLISFQRRYFWTRPRNLPTVCRRLNLAASYWHSR